MVLISGMHPFRFVAFLGLLGTAVACAPMASDQIPLSSHKPKQKSEKPYNSESRETHTVVLPKSPPDQHKALTEKSAESKALSVPPAAVYARVDSAKPVTEEPLPTPKTPEAPQKISVAPMGIKQQQLSTPPAPAIETKTAADIVPPGNPAPENSRVGSEFPDYVLGSSDVLRITVFGEADLTNSYTVDAGGMIAMPLIGDLKLAGLTLRQAEEAIEASLAQGYLINPSVSIEVTTYRPFYIMGEVRNPGSYPYVANMSVLNAVALAGGFTYRARQSEVELMSGRPGAPREYEDTPVNTLVYPGDIIVVEERFF